MDLNDTDDAGGADTVSGSAPLDRLAGEAARLGATDLDASEAQHQQQQQAGAAPAGQGGPVGPAIDLSGLEAGAQRVILGLLRAVRERLAVKLPEIRQEWPDAMLQEPAQQAMPLLRKYAVKLLTQMGENAELGAFAFSLLPLVIGYQIAQDKHAKTIDAEPAGAE
jgi:hypothetical protein